MPITPASFGDFPIIYGFNRTDMQASKTLHAVMLPHRISFWSHYVPFWANALTHTAGSTLFCITDKVLIYRFLPPPPLFVVTLAHISKNLPCVVMVILSNSLRYTFKFPFCKPCPNADTPLGSRIPIRQIV